MNSLTTRSLIVLAIALLALPMLSFADTLSAPADTDTVAAPITDTAATSTLSDMVSDLVSNLSVDDGSTTEITPDSSTSTMLVPESATTSPQADQPQYKQSFAAHLTGTEEVPQNASTGVGEAIFNVSGDERTIDFGVASANTGSITDIVLACAPRGANGITVVSLLHTATQTSVSGQVAGGSITDSDLQAAAVACNPNIHTTSHLVQAMREGSIYINILTTAYPNGEIRGQLTDSASPILAPLPTTPVIPVDPGTPATTTDPMPGTGGDTGGDTGSGTGSSSSHGGHSHHSGSSSSNNGGTEGQVLGASTGTCSTYLTGYIGAGLKNDTYNVALLQIFLNDYLHAGLGLNGIYDSATQASVKAFQLKEYDTVLRPWVAFGLPTDMTATGYVYKTTKWRIDNIVCGTNTPMPQLP